MRDASLDEFLPADEESEAGEAHAGQDGITDETGPGEPDPGPEAGGEDGNGSENGNEEPPPAADVDPARSTYAWSPGGAACAACGERVEERWESEDGLVCVSCKEW